MFCRLCKKWRCTTPEHYQIVEDARAANAHLLPDDPDRVDEHDTCQQIPMPATGMNIYYACLYPEERFLTEEDEDARAGQRAGTLPWWEAHRDELCGDDPLQGIRDLQPDDGEDGEPPGDPPPPDQAIIDRDVSADVAEAAAEISPSAGPARPVPPPAAPHTTHAEGANTSIRQPRGRPRAQPAAQPAAPRADISDPASAYVDGYLTRSRARADQQRARVQLAHTEALNAAANTPRASRPRRPSAPPEGAVRLRPRGADPSDHLPEGDVALEEPAPQMSLQPRPRGPAEPDLPAGTDSDLDELFGDGEDPNPSGGDAGPGRAGISEEVFDEHLDEIFYDCDEEESDEDLYENCPYDFTKTFEDDDYIESVKVESASSTPVDTAGMIQDFMCCARGAIMMQMMVAKAAAGKRIARLKGQKRRERRTAVKQFEARGETDELIGHIDHQRVPVKEKINARIKLKPGKQKQAIKELIDFQKTVGAPSTSEGFSDHDDPLTKWVARVTKTLNRNEALKDGRYNVLDWDAGIQKECKTMRSFGVMGKVYAEDEVIHRRFYNVARLLGAWAIKNIELAVDSWQARYRCVYGGNDSRRADGSTAYYATSASLPASLRDFRIFAVIASLHSWTIWLGDVTGAYLNATAPPDTFVTLSEEMIDHLLSPEEARKYRSLQKAGRKPVVELIKALYGHTQAGFLWEAEARKQLLKMGFVNFTDVSSAWYVHYTEEGKMDGMLLLYVDDFMLAGTDHFRTQTVAKMKEVWELKDGDIHPIDKGPIVGTRYDQHFVELGSNPITNVIVDQRSYSELTVNSFLQDTGCKVTDLKKTEVPAVHGEQCVVMDKSEHIDGAYAEFAAAIIGKLMWLCRTGLFMITIAVHNLSRHVVQWSEAVDGQCRRLMSYINLHKEGVLLMRTAPQDLKQKKLKLLVFSDADHAGDIKTRKSVSGCGIVLSGPNGTWSLLEWISRAQRTISLSTGESELLAAQLSLREALIVLLLLEILQVAVDVELLVDSTTALSVLLTGLSSKMRYAAKSQGLATAWCAAMLRDFEIRARKVATDHNLADIFTKAVEHFTFSSLTRLCGWIHPSLAKKPRCKTFHASPAHDEPTRCLNFVEKAGDQCAACLTPEIGCRCFNGASKWDIRTDESVDRIPIGSTAASVSRQPDASPIDHGEEPAEALTKPVTDHQINKSKKKTPNSRTLTRQRLPTRRAYNVHLDDEFTTGLPTLYWATPLHESAEFGR